jgi:VanZ family protein
MRRLRPLLPFLVLGLGIYWAVIFTLTHIPNPIDLEVDHIDKLAHAAAYAGLSFLLGLVLSIWRGYRASVVIGVWLLALAYGAVDEYSQQFVPNREADPLDLAADMVGATVGLVGVHLAVLAWRLRRSGRSFVPAEVRSS